MGKNGRESWLWARANLVRFLNCHYQVGWGIPGAYLAPTFLCWLPGWGNTEARHLVLWEEGGEADLDKVLERRNDVLSRARALGAE